MFNTKPKTVLRTVTPALPTNGHDLLAEFQAKVAEYNKAATERQKVVRDEITRLQSESGALTEVQLTAGKLHREEPTA